MGDKSGELQIAPLSWEFVVDKYHRLVKFAAKQQIQNHPNDDMISVEDLYQEGMLQLYDSWTRYGGSKGEEEFGFIFKASLFRRMQREGGTKRNHIDLTEVTDLIQGSHGEEIIEKMYLNTGIKYLVEMLSNPVAKRVVEELMEPSTETLFQVWADIKRKEMLKSQGKKVNIPKDNTVRMKHIQRALKITTKQYDIAMEEIRSLAPIAFAR